VRFLSAALTAWKCKNHALDGGVKALHGAAVTNRSLIAASAIGEAGA
jgi:hypothetical protein